MTAYILRRLMQTAVLVAVMSVIVFFGIHIVGDPVWLLVNPQMDQKRHRGGGQGARPRPADLGAVFPLRERRTARRSRPLLHLRRAGADRHPPAHARHPRARLHGPGDGDRRRHPARPLRRTQARQLGVQDDHGGLHRRLQPADLLGRADADHGVCGHAGLAALHRARRHRHLSRHHLQPLHARRPAPHPAAGAQPGAAQVLPGHPPDARRRTRGPAAGLHQVRPRQGALAPTHRRRASAQEHPDPRGDRRRPRVRQPRGLLRRHRDHLRLARHGQAPDQRHPEVSTGP